MLRTACNRRKRNGDAARCKQHFHNNAERAIPARSRPRIHRRADTLQEQGLDLDSGVQLVNTPPSNTGDILWNLAIIIVPVVLIAAFFLFMMRQAQGQNNQALGFGKSKAKLYG